MPVTTCVRFYSSDNFSVHLHKLPTVTVQAKVRKGDKCVTVDLPTLTALLVWLRVGIINPFGVDNNNSMQRPVMLDGLNVPVDHGFRTSTHSFYVARGDTGFVVEWDQEQYVWHSLVFHCAGVTLELATEDLDCLTRMADKYTELNGLLR